MPGRTEGLYFVGFEATRNPLQLRQNRQKTTGSKRAGRLSIRLFHLYRRILLLRHVLSDIQRDRDVDDDTKSDPLCVRVDAQELQCCFQEFEDCNTDDCG